MPSLRVRRALWAASNRRTAWSPQRVQATIRAVSIALSRNRVPPEVRRLILRRVRLSLIRDRRIPSY